MKCLFLLLILNLTACTNSDRMNRTSDNADTLINGKETSSDNNTYDQVEKPKELKVYANDRFKEVTVEQIGEHQFLIKGKGQIFEASFNWVIEDGHMELQEGFEMTDAGAPEWGNFQFTVDVKKERPQSTLMLIIFETSAKDGSRQHELPLLLY